MRILVLHNRIHRAFPELDGYSDEQCRKFIRAARRGLVRGLAHIGLIFLVGGAVLVGGMIAIAWLAGAMYPGGEPDAAVLAMMLIPISAAPISGYLTRDLLLWRRIRHVLRAHGTCTGCGYSLIGLPVSPGNTVTCPECSLECDVDPSLGELTLDAAGMARFRPSGVRQRAPRIFTPHRVRIIKRTAIWAAIILGVGIPALWGGYELWLRYQAGIALAEKPGVEAVLALVEANQPPGSEGGANAWDVLQEALVLRAAAERAESDANPLPQSERPYPDFPRIGEDPRPDWTPEEAWQAAKGESLARRLLVYYRDHGVFEAMDRMAAAPRAVRALQATPGRPLWDMQFSDLGQMRHFARVNRARMRLALERGDLAEYASALESTFALVRIASSQPTLIDGLTAVAIESMVYAHLHELLRSHPSPEWLDAVDAAISRQRPAIQPGYHWEGERLFSLDHTCWVFSEPARVRLGRYSSELEDLISEKAEGRLGAYAQNRDVLNARFDALGALAKQPAHLRPSTPQWPGTGGLVLIEARSMANTMILQSFNQAELTRAAFKVAAALERSFAANGAYPRSLDALVPSFLPATPIDPFTGKPFGYLPRAPDADPRDPRAYILYSFGEDRTDNGGLRYLGNQMPALQPTGAGTDYIINDWQPPDGPSR